MLKVLQDEHRRNFRHLLSSASAVRNAQARGDIPSSGSGHLLSFYAAEVGLKYLLNKVAKIPFRHEQQGNSKDVESFSHGLAQMIAHLKVPAARVPAPPNSAYRCVPGFNDGSGGQKFSMQQAHEAWRYGLAIEAADENEITAYIGRITAYLEAEIA